MKSIIQPRVMGTQSLEHVMQSDVAVNISRLGCYYPSNSEAPSCIDQLLCTATITQVCYTIKATVVPLSHKHAHIRDDGGGDADLLSPIASVFYNDGLFHAEHQLSRERLTNEPTFPRETSWG